jgi:hypothetical protein
MSCLSPEEIEQLNILLKKLTDAGKKEFFRQNGK